MTATAAPAAAAAPTHRSVFRGLWIALVTPFKDGAVDHRALSALTARLRADGVSGFVACGSTGEAAALDKAEQLQVLHTVLQAAQGLPVVMGVSGYHQGEVLAQVRALADMPLAGILVSAPPYIRPSQEGLLHWFRTIADASAVPVVVYDIPYRTGATLTTETLLALAAHPCIQAIKDCGGNTGKTQALIADGRLQVLTGEDAQIFHTLALGGAGAISACAHWQAPRFVELMNWMRAGNLPEARRVWQALQPWVEACFAEPNPAALKAVLAQAGWMRNELRAPMMPASKALEQRLEALPGLSPR
ncbi:MAG: 4-hydroxy-tetrahydrodipicolinate synthase [Gammaproteobacteria bacterium]|nr:4-hydroxy-tetrahydrodipicolinate synthase [Gammaproteobacteria bacterium]MBU0829832.1 4-hydroxy-tetrahydrodipicolinate synthase [Gammaproteobacteria bacterium]MBU0891517.1 4-hydroxy-tetrahydrodipicolinate synthase [Gammaproteobacteria bacterium]MBU1351494.1 4-hydroxy-tetrahydrodipicolinate synthase [Gammaproteobacteria bacterium]MBU1816337.1 4-hydroxy-tetrahydrodipicolinate synthase [Gammaproteobacteria bacterium]